VLRFALHLSLFVEEALGPTVACLAIDFQITATTNGRAPHCRAPTGDSR
jgi:hypothetical protein